MQTFRTKHSTEIDITFSEPEKAKVFFIDDNEDIYFKDIIDFDMLCMHLSAMFSSENERFIDGDWYIFIEGFLPLKYNEVKNEWTTESVDYGKITVRYENIFNLISIDELKQEQPE